MKKLTVSEVIRSSRDIYIEHLGQGPQVDTHSRANHPACRRPFLGRDTQTKIGNQLTASQSHEIISLIADGRDNPDNANITIEPVIEDTALAPSESPSDSLNFPIHDNLTIVADLTNIISDAVGTTVDGEAAATLNNSSTELFPSYPSVGNHGIIDDDDELYHDCNEAPPTAITSHTSPVPG